MFRIKIVTLTAISTLALGLSACGTAESTTPKPAEDPTTAAPAEPAQLAEATEEAAAPAEETSAEDISVGGGSYSVTVDGEQVTIADATVVCQEAAGFVNIAIAGAGNTDQGFGMQLSAGDQPEVKTVGLLDASGNDLGYVEGTPMGSATATKEGNTYTVTGEGVLVDMANPTSMETVPFEVRVECN